MKSNKKKIVSSLYGFLEPILGSGTAGAVSRLKSFRIETVKQLAGVVQISIEKLSKREAKQKGVAASYLEIQKNRNQDAPILRLKRLLKISETEMRKIADACELVPEDHQRYYVDSGWGLGAIKQSSGMNGKILGAVSKGNLAKGFFLVPGYKDAGTIYDQGNRSTCVANATCSVLNYMTGMEFSRQFHYHQCKMVDRMIHLEGTTIEAAFRVLSDQSITDKGNVEESIWPYNHHPRRTEHQGPPPEKIFHTERVFTTEPPIFIGDHDKVNAIKYLLNSQYGGKGCPVVIGIPLYESFFSWSTAETGWVTLPLPGEAIVGHHAMTVVGYDDDRRLFLVRNSWGPHWAHKNDKNFTGHAWIPYEYISRFCHAGATIRNLKIRKMTINEKDRLCYRTTGKASRRKLSPVMNRSLNQRYGAGRTVTFFGLLVRVAIVILLWVAYKESIISLKDKVVSFFKENVDLTDLRETASERLDELNY